MKLLFCMRAYDILRVPNNRRTNERVDGHVLSDLKFYADPENNYFAVFGPVCIFFFNRHKSKSDISISHLMNASYCIKMSSTLVFLPLRNASYGVDYKIARVIFRYQLFVIFRFWEPCACKLNVNTIT